MLHADAGGSSTSKRILYTAISIAHLSSFHRPILRRLKNQGCHIHVAANSSPGFELDEADLLIDPSFARNPFSWANAKALFKLTSIIRKGGYDIVHCHTPVASVLTRLAALFSRGPRPTVIYTSHGFHFFPGGAISNWLLWFPVEWVLARFTDMIIVINRWDQWAANRLLHAKDVRLIPGMGVDLERFAPVSAKLKQEIKHDLQLQPDDLVIAYVAEFIPRKNHRILILMMRDLIKKHPTIRMLFVGRGPTLQACQSLVSDFGIQEHVSFLGYRRDVDKLLKAADVAVSASRHEGLGIGIVEAMASGLPIVATQDRGHKELIEDDINGWLVPQESVYDFINKVSTLLTDEDLRRSFGFNGQQRAQKFSVGASLATLADIYASFGVAKTSMEKDLENSGSI